MQKVITINLNGNAYQLDERGYDALVAYLDQAERKLAGNPDREEILADIEQAIGEKCLRFLGQNKTVVTAAEVAQIIAEMGPVEGSTGEATSGAGIGGSSSTTSSDTGRARSSGPAPRRLYLIKEGKMLGGVCTGLSAFFAIDVTIMRIIFLALAALTKGFWIIVYFVLMIVIPSANTSEERAAARGQPFNAQELIDRAKKQYEEFRGANWRGRWRRQRREWRREARRQQRYGPPAWWSHAGAAAAGPTTGYMTRVFAGFMVPILSLVNVVLFWGLMFGIASLVTKQEAFGEPLPPEMPMWIGILILCAFYAIIAFPLGAMRRATYVAVAGYHHPMLAAWDGMMSAGFGILILWFGYHMIPEVRDLVDSLPAVWDALRTQR